MPGPMRCFYISGNVQEHSNSVSVPDGVSAIRARTARAAVSEWYSTQARRGNFSAIVHWVAAECPAEDWLPEYARADDFRDPAAVHYCQSSGLS